jgi:hypothetical protein
MPKINKPTNHGKTWQKFTRLFYSGKEANLKCLYTYNCNNITFWNMLLPFGDRKNNSGCQRLAGSKLVCRAQGIFRVLKLLCLIT